MNKVYIVEKKAPVVIVEGGKEIGVTMAFTEGVFATEKLAKEYIKKRKALKDRDDRRCLFEVAPWMVEGDADVTL